MEDVPDAELWELPVIGAVPDVVCGVGRTAGESEEGILVDSTEAVRTDVSAATDGMNVGAMLLASCELVNSVSEAPDGSVIFVECSVGDGMGDCG